MPRSTKKTILIIANENSNTKEIFRKIKKLNYSSLFAEHFTDAIDQISSVDTIDLVLVDVDFVNDVNGVQVAQKILDDKKLPVVFMAINPEDTLISKMEAVSHFGIIDKNCTEYILKSTIELAINHSAKIQKLNLFEQNDSLKKSEQKYKQLFELSQDAIVLSTLGGKILDCNNTTVDMFKYDSVEDMKSIRTSDLYVNPMKYQRFRTYIKNNGFLKNFKIQLLQKDGTAIMCLGSSMMIQTDLKKDPIIMSSLRDVTRVYEKEKLLKKTLKFAKIGYWELDIQTNKLIWSDEMYRIFGLQSQYFTATYDAFLEAIYSDDRRKVDEAYLNSIHRGGEPFDVVHRVINKQTKDIVFVRERCEHERDADGMVVKSFGVSMDITELIENENDLLLMSNTIDDSKIIVLWVLPDGSLFKVNKEANKVLGYSEEEFTKLNIRDIDLQSNYNQRIESWSDYKNLSNKKKKANFQLKNNTVVKVKLKTFFIFNGDHELEVIMAVKDDK